MFDCMFDRVVGKNCGYYSFYLLVSGEYFRMVSPTSTSVITAINILLSLRNLSARDIHFASHTHTSPKSANKQAIIWNSNSVGVGMLGKFAIFTCVFGYATPQCAII